MEKVYKTSAYRVLVNLAFGVGCAVVIGFLSGIWLEEPWTYVAGGVMFVIYLLLVIRGNMISIHINGNNLTVRKRGNEIHSFQIDQCSFRARTKTVSGDTECNFTVITPDGSETNIDCELLGVRKFDLLLEDLGVMGENAPVHKVTTKR